MLQLTNILCYVPHRWMPKSAGQAFSPQNIKDCKKVSDLKNSPRQLRIFVVLSFSRVSSLPLFFVCFQSGGNSYYNKFLLLTFSIFRFFKNKNPCEGNSSGVFVQKWFWAWVHNMCEGIFLHRNYTHTTDFTLINPPEIYCVYSSFCCLAFRKYKHI